MADLCCGHGLTGLLFAALDRTVQSVTLLDRNKPPKADLVVEAVCEVAPWAREKVRWVEAEISTAAARLEPGTSIVAVHACGVRTDRAIEAAIELGGNVTVSGLGTINEVMSGPWRRFMFARNSAKEVLDFS